MKRKPQKPERTTRRPNNLSLDPEVVDRARRHAERHGTSVSEMVNAYLASLPDEADERADALSPMVRRLVGVAARGRADRDAHRAHLLRKYGGK